MKNWQELLHLNNLPLIDETFLEKWKNFDWSVDTIWDWFTSTASFHLQTYGLVAGSLLIGSVVIFVLLHTDWTKHATGYFLGSVMQSAVKSVFSLLTVGVGLSIFWLKNQLIARTRNLFRSIHELFR